MGVDAFARTEVAMRRPAPRSIFRSRRAACAHMDGRDGGRVQTFRLTGHRARIGPLWDGIYDARYEVHPGVNVRPI